MYTGSRSSEAKVGAALGALIAADAPALTALSVCYCELANDGLRPLIKALRRNSHLRTLSLVGNVPSNAFLRKRVLPAAARATTTLRSLLVSQGRAAVKDAVLIATRGGSILPPPRSADSSEEERRRRWWRLMRQADPRFLARCARLW
jgi:hypothetical protein